MLKKMMKICLAGGILIVVACMETDVVTHVSPVERTDIFKGISAVIPAGFRPMDTGGLSGKLAGSEHLQRFWGIPQKETRLSFQLIPRVWSETLSGAAEKYTSSFDGFSPKTGFLNVNGREAVRITAEVPGLDGTEMIRTLQFQYCSQFLLVSDFSTTREYASEFTQTASAVLNSVTLSVRECE